MPFRFVVPLTSKAYEAFELLLIPIEPALLIPATDPEPLVKIFPFEYNDPVKFISPLTSKAYAGRLQLIPIFIDEKKKVPGPTVANVRVDTFCVKREYDDTCNVLAVRELTLISLKSAFAGNVLKYPTLPRPATVEYKETVLKYPTLPRPATVDCKEAVLTYPRLPRPVTVDSKEAVLTYPRVPRPVAVDCKEAVLTYPSDPRPVTVDSKEAVLTYPSDPRPVTVEYKELTFSKYNVDIELCVTPIIEEKVEKPSFITAVEIPIVRISRENISDANVLFA